MAIFFTILAVILDIFAIGALIVTYKTMRDTWDKITEIERRLNRMERGQKE